VGSLIRFWGNLLEEEEEDEITSSSHIRLIRWTLPVSRLLNHQQVSMSAGNEWVEGGGEGGLKEALLHLRQALNS